MKTMPIDDLKNILDNAKNEGKKHLSVLDNDDKTCGLNEICIVEGTLLLTLPQQKKKGFLQTKTTADKMSIDDLVIILNDAKENGANGVSILDYSGKTHILNQIRSIDRTLLFEISDDDNTIINHNPPKDKFEAWQQYMLKHGLQMGATASYRAGLKNVMKFLNNHNYSAKFTDINKNLWEIEDAVEMENICEKLMGDTYKGISGCKEFKDYDNEKAKFPSNALKWYVRFLKDQKT